MAFAKRPLNIHLSCLLHFLLHFQQLNHVLRVTLLRASTNRGEPVAFRHRSFNDKHMFQWSFSCSIDMDVPKFFNCMEVPKFFNRSLFLIHSFDLFVSFAVW